MLDSGNNGRCHLGGDAWHGQQRGCEVSALAVTVSPNPTSGSVTIEANADEGEVTIFDLTGRQITTVELHDGRAMLDTSNFTQGMYTARITSDRGVSIVKLVKE